MFSFPEGEVRLERAVTLGPDGEADSFVELEAHLREGQALRYAWEADGRVAFNIHAHRERRVDYYADLEDREGAGTFGAPSPGAYYLMWQNRGPGAVEVRLLAVLEG